MSTNKPKIPFVVAAGSPKNLQPGEQAVWERLVKGNSTIGGAKSS